MNYNKLKQQWLREQEHVFKWWDFSHLDDRWENELLPWDYDWFVKSKLKSTIVLCLNFKLLHKIKFM